jgi:outer membrane lipoprotein-sorting protein
MPVHSFKKGRYLFLWILWCHSSAFSQYKTERILNNSFQSIIAYFEYEKNGNAYSEITKGLFFYSPEKIWLRITSPIVQYMDVTENSLIIYYPLSRKAFSISCDKGIAPPFISPFLGSLQKDFGLSKYGYRLDKYETRKDTIVSYWSPPPKTEIEMGQAIIKTKNDNIVCVITLNPYKQTEIRVVLENFAHATGKLFFPQIIHTIKNISGEKVNERTSLANLSFNTTIPDSILHFQVPDDAVVEDIEW